MLARSGDWRVPAPIPTARSRISGGGPNRSTRPARIRAPVGVSHSPSISSHRIGRSLDQEQGGGGRNRELPVGRRDFAAAQGHGAAEELVDPEPGKAGHRENDVHDRVDRAQFVEVDLIGVAAVHPSLDHGQAVEQLQGFRPNRGFEVEVERSRRISEYGRAGGSPCASTRMPFPWSECCLRVSTVTRASLSGIWSSTARIAPSGQPASSRAPTIMSPERPVQRSM